MRKRIYVIAILLLSTLTLCSCGAIGKKNLPQGYGKVEFDLNNTVSGRLTMIKTSFSIDGKQVGATGAEIAGGKCFEKGDTFSFAVTSEDVQNEKELEKIMLTLTAHEEDGSEYVLNNISLPSKFGDCHTLELRYEDGSYSVWRIQDNGVETRLTSN